MISDLQLENGKSNYVMANLSFTMLRSGFVRSSQLRTLVYDVAQMLSKTAQSRLSFFDYSFVVKRWQ